MLLSTCFNCLDGMHRRCEDRRECQCSICKRPERETVYIPNQHERVAVTPLDAEALGLPKEKAKRPSRVKPPRKLSTDPEMVAKREYMREYRDRVAQGEKMRRGRIGISDEQLVDIMVMHAGGKSAREIGFLLGLDHTGVARHIRAESGVPTETDLRRIPGS